MSDGQPVIQGQPGWNGNYTQTPTQLASAAQGGDGTGLYLFSGRTRGDALYAVAVQGGAGVRSYSYGSDGVIGTSVSGGEGGAGVRGLSASPGGSGVYGWHSERVGVWGESSIGVVGQSAADYGIGVEGDASGRGSVGVFGLDTGEGGIGVYASAPNPTSAALQVNGRAVFSSSGQIVVPAGSTSAGQSGLTLSQAASVLAMLQQDVPGVSVRAAVPDPAAGTVTVHLTAASATDVTVGWMAVN